MNHVEDAMPARKSVEFCGEFAFVSEFIIQRRIGVRLNVGGGGADKREINDERTGDDGLSRHEAPEARILAVVAIVAKDEILASGNNKLTVLREALHLTPPIRIDFRVGVGIRGKVVEETVGRGGLECRVGLMERRAVDINLAVRNAQAVAGKADDALDEQRRLGVMEDDDISAMDRAIRHEPTAEATRGRVDLAIEEKKIADEQRALHAFRGNEKRLKNKGEQEESDDYRLQQGGKCMGEAGQMEMRVCAPTVVG